MLVIPFIPPGNDRRLQILYRRIPTPFLCLYRKICEYLRPLASSRDHFLTSMSQNAAIWPTKATLDFKLTVDGLKTCEINSNQVQNQIELRASGWADG